MDMYQEIILDHYKNPQHKGEMQKPDASAKDSNPLCGDVIGMQVRISGNRIADVKFNGSGCAISQASADMLSETVKGKTLAEAAHLSKKDILDGLGIEISPVRLKCALLSLKVFKTALYSYMGKKADIDTEIE